MSCRIYIYIYIDVLIFFRYALVIKVCSRVYLCTVMGGVESCIQGFISCV